MAEIISERVTADVDGGVVLFMIGMRINRPWKIRAWWTVMNAMRGMLDELARTPALGLLGARPVFGLRNLSVIQYWRSAAHLTAYAHAPDRAHLPAWQHFNRTIGTGGDVGIWHETIVAPAGHAESVYVNMPPHGLGLLGPLVPARGERATATKRLSGLRAAAADRTDG